MPDTPTLSSRKDDHIRLCANEAVGFRARTTLLEEVELVHDALPELALADVDLRTTLFGKTLAAPLVIAAMTGGTPQATAINRDLARVAEELQIGFAFGSQRPLLVKGITDGYLIRDVAPTALVLGNIGVVQARESDPAALAAMLATAGCDALNVHLNPAMEVIQPEGDLDFRDGLPTIARLVEALPVPISVKETGCGLSRSVLQRVAAVGVRAVDVSGAGGTSWVGVEARRAEEAQLPQMARLGQRFWDWGLPTGASVAQASDLGLAVVATGGVYTGLDVARAIALGATAGGVARPFLQAQALGYDALKAAVEEVIQEIRIACLLAGARTPAALQTKPLSIGPSLLRWVPRGSSLRRRLVENLD